MKNQLTYIHGYKSMFFFLSEYFNKTRYGDIACLLSDIMFYEGDGEEILSTSDPASWHDWIDSIHKELPEMKGTKEGELTYFQAFKSMCRFLYEYRNRTSSDDTADILVELSSTASGDENSPYNPDMWQRWLNSIQKGLQAKSSAE